MSQVTNTLSRGLRMARVVADLHTPGPRVKSLTSEQKRIARHLAREGKSAAQIMEALGVNMHIHTFRRRLREINIVTDRAYAYHHIHAHV